jgi:hypothetical protein
MSDVDVTRCDAMRIMCARGDLNRARPTPVMPSSANLSVNELRLTPVSSSWSAARATRCGTVLVLTSCPTTRPSDGCQLHRLSVACRLPTHTSQLRLL